MALTLSKTGIEQNQTINAWHVTQSIDAFAGTVAYDVTLSGSLTLTGSVDSLNGYTGSLLGTASWAEDAISSSYAVTASHALDAISSSYAVTSSHALDAVTASFVATASKANNILISNRGTTDKLYRVAFVDPLNVPEIGSNFYDSLAVDSGSDGSGMYYNPSTDTLYSSIFSGQNDGSQIDFVGTASHAISAGYFADYVTGSYNETTIYPQGTIFSKFENVFMSQSAVEEYDLLAATVTYTGDRTLPTNYVVANTSGEAKMVKFHIRGNVGDTGALGTPTLDSYIKIGTTTLTNGTKLGAVNLEGANQVPFEIDYELTFTNNTVVSHGAVGYYDSSGNYKKIGLSDMYFPDSAPLTGGALQFIVSGSSAMELTGSSAYIEFIN